MKENRFRVLKQINPAHADELMAKADKLTLAKYDLLAKLAGLPPCSGEVAAAAAAAPNA
jgi:hypothetical protein